MPETLFTKPPSRIWPLRQAAQIAAVMLLLTVFAALNPARAQEAMLKSAVENVVVLRSAGNDDRFMGSGVIWAGGKLVVTNAHVVGNAESARVIDDTGQAFDGEIIARDTVRDVAVLVVKGLERPGLSLGSAPELGAKVWAIGAPLGLELTVTRGIVSASARQIDAAVPIRFLQHDAAVNPGSSGGPLLDADGHLVGLNSRIADGSRYYIGMSYAIAAADLARIVDGLVAETLPPVPKLGLQLRPVSRMIAAALGLEATGLLIDRVEPGLAASHSSLLAGDIILTAGGQPMTAPGDLAFAMDAEPDADSLSLRVLRGGVEIAILLPLRRPPADVLGMRGMDGSAIPKRITAYRLMDLGITLDDNAGNTARIRNVTQNSPALFAGIIAGDSILAINSKALTEQELARIVIDAPALVLLRRAGGATLHVILNPWDTGEGVRPVGGANVLDPAIIVF